VEEEPAGRVTALPWLLTDWPSDAIEDFRERAAIIEVDGRQPRDRAEAIAEEDVRRRWRRDRRAGDVGR